MWSVDDAQRLQRRGQALLKDAAKVADREERARMLSFTVVGGGATGVEIVGTLAQMLPKRVRERGLDPRDLRIHLVEGRDHILFDLPARQRAKAERRLEQMGVEVVTGAFVDRVEDGEVVLADGRRVDSAVLVWAAERRRTRTRGNGGSRPRRPAASSSTPPCAPPLIPDIYAIGDIAEARNPETGRTADDAGADGDPGGARRRGQHPARGAGRGAAAVRPAHARGVRQHRPALGRRLDVRADAHAASRRSP